MIVLVTAGVGIPLHCYLLTAVLFDHQRLDERFLRIFLGVLVLDQLWALSPFLLSSTIGFGGSLCGDRSSFVCTVLRERALVRMTYLKGNGDLSRASQSGGSASPK